MRRPPVNLNQFWAGLIIDELVRSGAAYFCISPGSRSTPLVVAIAEHPEAVAHLHVDERGSAFHALGYARANGSPAVWLTTSGTAAVNGHPAMVEAARDGVPLIALTADRPPELRDTGANQSIDQVHLFGSVTRWFFDLPVPTAGVDPAFLLTTVDHAVHRAREDAGPVHLNCMFREPLAPEPDGWKPDAHGGALWDRPPGAFTTYGKTQKTVSDAALQPLVERTDGAERGLIVVGSALGSGAEEAIASLSRRLQWPVFADARSGLRSRRLPDTLVAYHDPLLASEEFRGLARPDLVLHFGHPAVSKRLNTYLALQEDADLVGISAHAQRLDPFHRLSMRIECDPEWLAGTLARRVSARERAERLVALRRLSKTFEERLDERLGRGPLTEPAVARITTRLLPQGHGLLVGNSMPVRDADAFGAGARVVANRGASGIDGLVSTAAGLAAGLRAPVTAVMGDLALLHDLNGLEMLRRFPVTLVVVNNDGGGIFSFLPIADHHDVFETFFGTPHGRSFEHAARMFDLPYERPETTESFAGAYRRFAESGSSGLLEVRTDRRANHALHLELLELAGRPTSG